jgi:anti-anti-sigma regulatory factor
MTHDAPRPELHIETSTDGACTIKFRGELSLKHHAALHQMFREVTVPEKIIHIEILEPASIDLCFLQLLRAFTNNAAKQGQTVCVNATLAEADQKLIVRTGLHHLLHTAINP